MTTRRYHILIIIVLSILCGHVSAFNIPTAHGEGMGGAIVLSRLSASEMLYLPSSVLAHGRSMVEVGYTRQYNMKELDAPFVAAAYRYKSISIAVGVTQFGQADLYTEQTGRFVIAYHREKLSIAGSMSGMLIDIGGSYKQLSAATIGCGASYNLQRFWFGFEIDNITSPQLKTGSLPVEPQYNIFAELIGRGSYSITGRATLENNQKPQFAIGQWIDLSLSSAFFWGISTAPTKYGGGIEIRYRGMNISYATSYHPVLGLSYTASLGIGVGRIAENAGKME